MHETYMKAALREAVKAEVKDEVPIGCVIVKDGTIIARAHNLRESKQQSTAHAEIIAIEKACRKLGSWRLEHCILYVTLEPCPMCAGAILQSRIQKVVYGAADPKGGALHSCFSMYEIPGFNHYPEVEAEIMKEQCAALLKQFFKKKRMQNQRKANKEPS